ncbi:MAG TPA: 2-phospho-L-lactate transferase CofD family protein [Polyangiaceae bacterium]
MAAQSMSIAPARYHGRSDVRLTEAISMNDSAKIPRVVTIGGGHGQAVVLRALRSLECNITAVVATADDGGCSGELRRAFHMPAPGDLRRCLSALALDHALSLLLEERFSAASGIPRCRGNLVIARKYFECGGLQRAIDWVAFRLHAVGRVLAASEEPGTLVVCDKWQGLIEGEHNITNEAAAPLVVTVKGARQPNAAAIAAIERADVIIMGPGSFCTSTLSALVTGEVGAAVCRSRANRLHILNVANHEFPCSGFAERDFVSVLANHLTISSLGETPKLIALRHSSRDGERQLDDGTILFSANVASDDGEQHCEQRLAAALGRIMRLSTRTRSEEPEFGNCGAHRDELLQALAHAHDLLENRLVHEGQ